MDYESKFISHILNDPSDLPAIFKFLSWEDFADSDLAWIYHSFGQTYSGLEMDSNVWLKKMVAYLVENAGVNETENRVQLRALADDKDEGVNPVTLARYIRKESLHRKMIEAVDVYAGFRVFGGAA